MRIAEWVGFAGGIAVLTWTAASLVRTLIVPRGLPSRISRATERAFRAAIVLAVRRMSSYRAQDRLLAFLGPLSMLALLVTWLGMFLIGYALLMWPFMHGHLPSALRASGSAMFTLGFAPPHGGALTVLHLCAAATGLIVVALQIAYLPTLYAAFNRRETLVTMLATRAGLPAWGPEILARHHAVGTLDSLGAFYARWEEWSADVAESHANYPVLNDFRSPNPLRNWVLGLLAVMDSAAMYLAMCPGTAPIEARLFVRMGFIALRDIAGAIGLPFDPDPMPTDPITLTIEDFARGVERLAAVGFPMERSAAEAWPHFHGWRVNYEALAYGLADRVNAPPAAWSGPRSNVQSEPIALRAPIDRRVDDERTMAEPRRTTRWGD